MLAFKIVCTVLIWIVFAVDTTLAYTIDKNDKSEYKWKSIWFEFWVTVAITINFYTWGN